MNRRAQKRLLLLGGLRYLIPVIKTAHELGCYVITCDYLPDNIAHRYSDEYVNANIVDKEAVLAIAKELQIDGIMSFAVDPGVLTAAYVAEELGLPGCPYASVKILQNKALFREFLTENGFNVPQAKGYYDIEQALNEIDNFALPVIVKPVDAAGSKGVVKVEVFSKLKEAAETAIRNSVAERQFIIEEFIEKEGFSSDTDSFSINNELRFVSFSNQMFDNNAVNPYAPSAYSWPSTIKEELQKELCSELQRLISLLNLGTSLYNIEVRVGTDGKGYIMEVSPRGGGNRLSEMLRYATGTDLIKNAVKAAIGEEPDDLEMPKYDGHWAEVILHSDRNGVFDKIEIAPRIEQQNVVEVDLWVSKGDNVRSFNGANDAIGTLVLRFGTQRELSEMMDCQKDWLKVLVKQVWK